MYCSQVWCGHSNPILKKLFVIARVYSHACSPQLHAFVKHYCHLFLHLYVLQIQLCISCIIIIIFFVLLASGGLCGNIPYNRENASCCRGQLSPGIPEIPGITECAGTTAFLNSQKKVCQGKLHTLSVESGNQECCGTGKATRSKSLPFIFLRRNLLWKQKSLFPYTLPIFHFNWLFLYYKNQHSWCNSYTEKAIFFYNRLFQSLKCPLKKS